MRAGEFGRRWEFRPQPVLETRGYDADRRRSLLRAALRAGHGIGAEFELCIGSGAEGVVSLRSTEPATERWVTRVLLPACAPHRWVPGVSAPPAEPMGERWDADRQRAWPDALRAPSDGVPLIDTLALALGAFPAGVRCRWQLRPSAGSLSAGSEPAWGEPGDTAPPNRGTARPVGRPAREDRPALPTERPLFWDARVSLEIACSSAGADRGARVARLAEAGTRGASGNGLRFRRRRRWHRADGRHFPLADPELALVWPGEACPAPATPQGGRSTGLPVLALGRSRDGTVLGPRIEPEQGRHLAVLGETGMGKSSLLVAIGRRVAAGSGLVFFDPLGDSARQLRTELASVDPGRLAWVAPGEPVGLNALAGIAESIEVDPARCDRQLNDLVHSLRRVRSGRYADSGFWGPRLEEMLSRALRAAAAFPQGTLADAHLLLSSGGRGFRGVPPIAMEATHELADRIRSRPDDAEGARRLLYEVTRNPTLTRMLCARAPDWRARDLVAPGRVVLIAGDAGRVGESTARYLLSIYLALVWSELLSREAATKTFVVLDEAQWFVHESLAEMLRLGRRLNVHVVLATQAIASLPEAVGEAVWTNVADFVAFRGSPEEARELGRVSRGLSAEGVLSLPRGEAALLLGKGNDLRWVRAARVLRAPDREVDLAPATEGLPSAEGTLDTRSEAGEPSPTTSPDRVAAVLAAIERRTRTGGDGPRPISLSELRAEADPDGQAVRALGDRLRRSGAILRSERNDTGSIWWVDPARLRAEPPASAPAPVPGGADEAQP